MANRHTIAYLLVALLIIDAASAQLGTVAKPNFRGQNKVLAMERADPVKQPIKHQAIIDQVAGVNKGKKKEKCTKPPKKDTCTKKPPKYPSYHNTYELKYQTVACTMKTIDQIVQECATIDIIKEKPECIKKVITKPVKVNKINQVKKKIKVVVPVQKKIQVLKTVQKPVQTLVTECVTVYEVVQKTVCVETLQDYDVNERHVVEEKVNIRYEEPKKTEIRVVKPVQKKIKVIKTGCVKYEASLSQKTCDEQGEGYGVAGNQYKAVKAGVKGQKQAAKGADKPVVHQRRAPIVKGHQAPLPDQVQKGADKKGQQEQQTQAIKIPTVGIPQKPKPDDKKQ
jgi:hypothetical protein